MSELCWEVPGALPGVSGAARSRLPNTPGEEPPLERKLILCITSEGFTSLAAITLF